MSRSHAVLLALTIVFVAGCTHTNQPQRPHPADIRTQSTEQIAEVQASIRPTEQRIANVDPALLWKAAHGYMDRVFPLVEANEKAAYIETKTVEWEANRLPHRTRITVTLDHDTQGGGHSYLRVVALLIEPHLELSSVTTGKPIQYGWLLQGSNPDIEQVVSGQIMRRYLLLREGRNPDDVPIEGAIPGLSPEGAYFAPGTAGVRR